MTGFRGWPRKGGWAYQELKSFLRIVLRENVDPLEIRGSYAGAVGMAQFVPSSYLSYAESRNGFEKWLTSKEDAVFSIGNYLKSHGWNKNLTLEKKKRVLWYYNHSKPYIDTSSLSHRRSRTNSHDRRVRGKERPHQSKTPVPVMVCGRSLRLKS